jgi:hypothetical protein
MTDDPRDFERLDPLTMAEFLVLPGAARVVQAFSRIPPGRLRSSAVAHLEAMADEYADPTDGRNFNPLAAFATPRAEAPALAPPPPGPHRALTAAQAETPEMQAVIHMMNGLTPLKAAEVTGLSVGEVREARKRALAQGVTFPKMQMTQIVTGTPVKPKKPARVQHKNFPINVEDIIPGPGMSRVQSAARERGLTVEGYMAQRRSAVHLFRKGASPLEVAQQIGISHDVAKTWKYNAGKAGLLEGVAA